MLSSLLVEAAIELGAESADSDVLQANIVQQKSAELERYVAANLPTTEPFSPTMAEVSRADRMKAARASGWEHFWSEAFPDAAAKVAGKALIAVPIGATAGIAYAAGKYAAILNVIKAMLKFFA